MSTMSELRPSLRVGGLKGKPWEERAAPAPRTVDAPGDAEIEAMARAIHEADHETTARTQHVSPSAWDADSVDPGRHTTLAGAVNVLEAHHRNHFRKLARAARAAQEGR